MIATLAHSVFNRFRWVFCQLETLRNCLPQDVRRVLSELPESLDESYERTLREILKANPDKAYRLLQCLAVATRPLRVEELAEVLALDFGGAEGGIPTLNENWRQEDKQQDILAMCSSLIVVVDIFLGIRIVQFAHFSVKEFLTSDRLANLRADISRFHIQFEPAHTVMTQACLAILLQSRRDGSANSTSPLSNYAARNWVNHAHFENVSSHVEDGMRQLFDPAKPSFTAWLNLYNPDREWRSFPPADISVPIHRPSAFTSQGEADAPLCLYYAALCGFSDLARHLVTKYPQHVNALVGLNKSSLVAALCNGHIPVARLLHRHGAVLHTSYGGRTLLHAASKDGMVDVSQWLLQIGVDVNAQQDDRRTPLHLAAANGQLDIVQTLLEHSADVSAIAGSDNHTPLHEAVLAGNIDIAWLLVRNGADESADLPRLLHSVSLLRARSVDAVLLLIQLGVDVNAQDEKHNTSLHLATSVGNAETVETLIKHGANGDAKDRNHNTPLHLALSGGHAETLQVLVQNGANVNAQDEKHKTPLHLALSKGHLKAALLLLLHGADVKVRDKSHSTPLHLASSWGNVTVMEILIQMGADVNAKDESLLTPLHLASLEGNADTVQLLIKHGANVHAHDQSQSTPLHMASSLSSWSNSKATVDLLIKHGARVNAYNRHHQTPLHLIVSSWSPNTDSLQLLLRNGADVNVRDDKGQTPFQVALSEGNHEVTRLLALGM